MWNACRGGGHPLAAGRCHACSWLRPTDCLNAIHTSCHLRHPAHLQLSASQRNMRLCSRGGPPGLLCTVLHTLLVPQLPAALSPPALFAAARTLLYAAAWLLYNTAALTIPLALWAAFAADGSLALTPVAAAAAAQVLPAAVDPLPLPALLAAHRGAGLLLLPLLLLALRVSEAAVLRHRQQCAETAHRAVTTADVQAHFAGWALPGSGASHDSELHTAAAARAAAGRHEQQQQQLARQQKAELLREVGQLWQAVYGESLHAEHVQTLQGGQGSVKPGGPCFAGPVVWMAVGLVPASACRALLLGLPWHVMTPFEPPAACLLPPCVCADVAGAVGRLCKDTGVPVPAVAAAAGSDNNGALLLGMGQQIKAAVGVA